MQDLSFIAWCLEHLNYGTIFLLMTIESSFIPFPSEVVVPPAGYLARAGELSSWGVVLASSLGAIAGALINYLLALWLGRPLVYRFVNSRLGHALLLSEAKLIKAEQYFDKRGAISTFIGRLLPGIRQLISIPAGLAKMPLATFLFYTLLGAGHRYQGTARRTGYQVQPRDWLYPALARRFSTSDFNSKTLSKAQKSPQQLNLSLL